jgi:signal transduction histidine kinase
MTDDFQGMHRRCHIRLNPMPSGVALQSEQRRKDEFLAMASHELKTPVTGLKTFVQTLAMRAARTGDQTLQGVLRRMEGQINRLIRLVQDLLDISRLQTGQLHKDRALHQNFTHGSSSNSIRCRMHHIIVLDMLLSGSDGRQVLRTLKAQPATRAIPVIMFSAYPSAEASAWEAGADAFLAKPFEGEDLLASIARLLSASHTL